MVVGVEAGTVERRGEMAIHIVLFLHNKSSGHALGHETERSQMWCMSGGNGDQRREAT